MAESIPFEDFESGETSSHCRYFKMKTLDGHEKSQAGELVVE
jgi:hypothetical protein